MAGARIQVKGLADVEVEQLVQDMFEEFCAALGVREAPRRWLIEDGDGVTREAAS